jgi:riboflavin kinase / FMN adenylyltransferase
MRVLGETWGNPGFELAPETHRRDVVLTIGVFDGVHLGHRHLAHQVIHRARDLRCLSGILTFDPHPQAVLRPGHAPRSLATVDERLFLLRQLGLDIVTVLPFTPELARLPAREFMRQVCDHLRVRELWVGQDFALGHDRAGTATCLAGIGRELGYEVRVAPPLVIDGQTVSSSLIRKLVSQGQVEAAARLLKRRHHVRGTVIAGDQRGDPLGAPTRKLVVADGWAVPAEGDYAVSAGQGGRRWVATARVSAGSASAEAQVRLHNPHRTEELVGESLRVEFIRRLTDTWCRIGPDEERWLFSYHLRLYRRAANSNITGGL